MKDKKNKKNPENLEEHYCYLCEKRIKSIDKWILNAGCTPRGYAHVWHCR